MSLEQRLQLGPIPTEWQARQVIIGDEAEIVTGPIREVGTHRELLEQFGYSPDEFEIAGTVNQWRKEQADGSWLTSYFFKVRPMEARLDLPALMSEAKRKPRNPIRGTADSRVTVVALSDVQAGKTGARGGTPELLVRLADTRARLEAHLKRVKPSATVLLEAGDLFEHFESGGNPMFLNDLSLSQQMDLAGTVVYQFVESMHRHGRVDVVAVPSNHTAWRRGKTDLGRPGDDLGLFVHKQVAKQANAAGLDAHWTVPGEWDEAAVIDVLGTRIGVSHGHRARRNGIVDWWAKQGHGGQPVGSADVLVTGHYHHLVVMPTGRNPYTGKSKYWLQCPTLDNGSDWFRNMAGEDSDPGLLVFDVTEDGLDLQSLTVL
jgi:hypothetical protein